MHKASYIASYLETVSSNFTNLRDLSAAIESAAAMVCDSLRSGGVIYFCGNGGSAADSQHLAAELVGRYKAEREALSAIALTVDSSALTAIANDYGYDRVFARQLSGLGKRGDVLIALSTSGNSDNVLAAIAEARRLGIGVVGFTGAGGGRMSDLCDILLSVPSAETNHIQEMHIAMGHIICGIAESSVLASHASHISD